MPGRGSKKQNPERRVYGLGFIPDELQHGFVLHLPTSRSSKADVFISEHRDFVLEDDEIRARPVAPADPDTRVRIKRLRWDEIAALGFDEHFRRLWDFYFCYCEGGFDEAVLGSVQFLFAKPQARVPAPAELPQPVALPTPSVSVA